MLRLARQEVAFVDTGVGWLWPIRHGDADALRLPRQCSQVGRALSPTATWVGRRHVATGSDFAE